MIEALGTERHSLPALTVVQELKRGEERQFSVGDWDAGCGIIDDVLVEEVKELVHQIQGNGKKEPICYRRNDFEEESRKHTPRDSSRFDLETEKMLLKRSLLTM